MSCNLVHDTGRLVNSIRSIIFPIHSFRPLATSSPYSAPSSPKNDTNKTQHASHGNYEHSGGSGKSSKRKQPSQTSSSIPSQQWTHTPANGSTPERRSHQHTIGEASRSDTSPKQQCAANHSPPHKGSAKPSSTSTQRVEQTASRSRYRDGSAMWQEQQKLVIPHRQPFCRTGQTPAHHSGPASLSNSQVPSISIKMSSSRSATSSVVYKPNAFDYQASRQHRQTNSSPTSTSMVSSHGAQLQPTSCTTTTSTRHLTTGIPKPTRSGINSQPRPGHNHNTNTYGNKHGSSSPHTGGAGIPSNDSSPTIPSGNPFRQTNEDQSRNSMNTSRKYSKVHHSAAIRIIKKLLVDEEKRWANASAQNALANAHASNIPMFPPPNQIIHQLAGLGGIYANETPPLANPKWEIDRLENEFFIDFPKLMSAHPDHKFNMIYPTRFFHSQRPKYYRLAEGVKEYPNQDVHLDRLAVYLHELYQAGILYKRKHAHEWELHPNVTKREPWETSLKTSFQIFKNYVTGKVFVINKKPHLPDKARLVVNYSQYSHCGIKYPKFVVPSPTTLANTVTRFKYFISLDLKSAFFQLPISIEHSTDRKSVV